MKNKLLHLIPIFTLSACVTATKPTNIPFSPVTVPPDSAIVYVYNPHANQNEYQLWFLVNDEEQFVLPDSSYGFVNLPEGDHRLKFRVNNHAQPGEAKISVFAGQEYYVRAEPTTADFSGVSGSIFDLALVNDAFSKIEIDIRAVDKAEARREIYRTTLALGVPDLGEAISASSPAKQAINSDHVVNLVTPTPEATAVESISGANIGPDSELDLRALVSGATRSGVSSKGWRFHVYAAPDGQMFVRTETNKKKVLTATGTWEINQSNQLCENFNDLPQGHCLTVTPLGGNKYMTQATEPSSRIEVAFSKGDTQGLDTRPASALSTVGKAALPKSGENSTEGDSEGTDVDLVKSDPQGLGARPASALSTVDIAALPKSGENSADSDNELHALISHATWWGKTKKGVNFIVYATPDGELFGRSTSRSRVETWDTGLWDVNKSGQLCRRWDRQFKPRIWGCMEVRPLGGNRYLMRDEDDTTGIEVVIVKGDPKGLDTRGDKKYETSDLSSGKTKIGSTNGDSKSEPAQAVSSSKVTTLKPKISDSGNTQSSTSSSGYSKRNISGTYQSDITSNHSRMFYVREHRELVLELKQQGSVITGTDQVVDSEINGTIKEDTIELTFRSKKIDNGAKLKIVWEVGKDGRSLQGTWKLARTGQYGGTWNLTRIE